MEALLLHLVGDYITQTQWMADNKVKRWWPALVHATLYALPFLVLGSTASVFVIWATHAIIDRFSLAKYVIVLKNSIGPGAGLADPQVLPEGWTDDTARRYARDTWNNFGLPAHVPKWIAFPVYVAVDNTMHLLINYAALRWL